ncbi:MAG: hypothetical protein ACK4TP_10145 [Hyphomicrobium sp.]
MTIDTVTLVAVYKRILHAPVLLFHEVRTPARHAARKARISRWMGRSGLMVANDYLWHRTMPTDTRRQWKRGGHV